MDILLDEATHDIVFLNDGNTPVTVDVSDGLKQRLKIKLLTFRGEWFLNTNYGTPYFQEIFGKKRKKATVDAIFRRLILEDSDVSNMLEFSSELTNRRYSLSFKVRSVSGTTLEIEELEVGV